MCDDKKMSCSNIHAVSRKPTVFLSQSDGGMKNELVTQFREAKKGRHETTWQSAQKLFCKLCSMALIWPRVAKAAAPSINSGDHCCMIWRLGEKASLIHSDFMAFCDQERGIISDYEEHSPKLRFMQEQAKGMGLELTFPLVWPRGLLGESFAYPNVFSCLSNHSGLDFAIDTPAVVAEFNHAKGVFHIWQLSPYRFDPTFSLIFAQSVDSFSGIGMPGGWHD